MEIESADSQMAKLWADVLGVDRLEPDANFFDMGGHSLLAIRLMARVQELFAVDLPLSQLFQNPRLDEFSAIVGGGATRKPASASAPPQQLPAAEPSPDLSNILESIDQLSDAEAAQLLALIESPAAGGG